MKCGSAPKRGPEEAVQVPLTPLEFKQRAAALFGTKIGVVDGDRRFTYAQFAERVDRLANGLLAMGLARRDRVAYLAYNSHQLLEGYFGVLAADGILLPLNVRLAAAELAYILNDAGVRFLLIDPDFLSLFEAMRAALQVRPDVVWLGPAPPGRSEAEYEDALLQASPGAPPPLDLDENDVAELFYTSGTTGRPKGVMLTHRNLYLHALATMATTSVTDAEVQLHTIPLFHVNGWGTPQALTAAGGTHVMLRRFDPAEALRLIEAEKVTRFFAVATMLTMLLNHPDMGTRDLSSLSRVMLGGAPTPVELIRQAEETLGCKVHAGYGLSETSPVLTVAESMRHLGGGDEERMRRQASTGVPVIGADVRVVGDDGREVSRDGQTVGEIIARSNVVMAGYWNDSDGTDAVIRDGWFHTGDMAVVDGDGYILIVDRRKDIIISGGENISSVEIEKVLFEHPAILESAVIAVPDEEWGEVPKALVALRQGAAATEEDLIAFCRGRMARFKVPRSVDFLETLPKGGTGKILKAQLRAPYWAKQEKRVH
jgi:fatty-acyl-CoA synthase